jgi:hypothetical protein
MRKQEIESILLDCEKAKQFCECMQKCDPCIGHRGAQDATTALQQVGPTSYSPGPTADEIRSNYAHSEHYQLSPALLSLVPSLADKDPRESLERLTKRYYEYMSERNARLVEDAINRLILFGPLDESGRELVQKAVEALGIKKDAESKQPGEIEGDNIWATLFEHPNFNGRAILFNEWPDIVYKAIPELDSAGFNDCISSLQVQTSAYETGGYVVLFENNGYFGRYSRFEADPGVTVGSPYVGGFINDRTSSVLLIRRFINELTPTPLGSLVSTDTIKDLVKSRQGITPRGQPVITWDLFPRGPSGGSDSHPNEPDKAYVYIKIPISVDVPNWFDYDAEIRYWIYLYVDQAGVLQGYVDYYGAWVEGGIFTGRVLAGVMADIPNTLSDVSGQLAPALALSNAAGPYSRVYLLPGRNDQQGDTNDDVTVVLVRRPDPVDGPPIL